MWATTTAAAPTVTTSAERAAAGRQAIADCPEAFEDLRGEGDRENALEAEYQMQLDSYRSARHTAFTDEDADLAYGPTDPKHPGFRDRVDA